MISARIDNFEAFERQIREMIREFPREVQKEVQNTALEDVESFMKTKTNIPVDTGRLRASIHTKRIGKPSHQYTDRESNSYNGTLTGQVSREQVIVGTNVEYAEYINERGGGGPNSRRTVRGAKRPKGYGKGFFNKAVENGEKRLIERMEDLINRLGDMI